MKKYLSIFAVCLAALVLFSACGDNTAADKPEEPQVIIVSPSAAPAALPLESAPVSASPEPSAAPTPTPTPTPSATPSPTPTPTPTPKLSITKHPSGENLSAGMTTWFVARAQNYSSIAWQFLDTKGSVHSVDETETLNPGLKLDIVGSDTIELRSVPLSLNGWSCRAAFTGLDGSVQYTNPASITVTSVDNYYYSKYSSVIDNYKALKYGGADTYGLSTDLGVTEELKYSLDDMDGDGVPELFIACPDTAAGAPWNQVIYSMFRLVDGKPVKVFQSSARNRYVYSGMGFINTGSGGASDTVYTVYHYSGGSLVAVEGVYCEYSETKESGIAFYRFTGGSSDSGQKSEISQDQFFSYVDSYDNAARILAYSSFK